jgi:hypothetical protein
MRLPRALTLKKDNSVVRKHQTPCQVPDDNPNTRGMEARNVEISEIHIKVRVIDTVEYAAYT